jgi:hypothetical protein
MYGGIAAAPSQLGVVALVPGYEWHELQSAEPEAVVYVE